MALSDTATLAVEFRYASNLGSVASSDEATLAALDQANATAGQSYLSLGDKAVLAAGEARDALGNLGDATATTAANLRDDLGQTVGRVGEAFDHNRAKIREFARAGSELSIVASFLGQDFKEALGPVGEFIRVAGDAGLVVSTLADLGPAAAGGIAKLLGLGAATQAATAAATAHAAAITAEGAAATAATPEIAGLTAAEGAAGATAATAGGAAGVGGLAAVLGTFALPVTAGAAALAGLTLWNQHVKDDALAAAVALEAEKGYVVRLDGSIVKAVDGLTSYDYIIQGIRAALDAMGSSVDQSGVGIVTVTGSAKDAADAFEAWRLKTLGESDALDSSTSAARKAYDAVSDLKQKVEELPEDRRVNVTVDVKVTDPALLAFITGSDAPLGQPGHEGQGAANGPKTEEPITTTTRTSRSAATTRQAYDNLSSTFSDARQKATTFFDTLHQKNLQAIQDTLALARTEHDAASQRIADRLREQLAENAKPVTAAEKALQDTQRAEQRRNLEEAVNAAYTTAQANPTDESAQRALRDAREALANFNAQVNIDSLRDQQNAADAKAQAQATADQKAVDATLTAAEKKAKAETDKENAADKARRAAWTREETELQTHLTKVHATQKTAAAQVEKLWQGVVDDLSGKTKPGQTAIPHITLTVNIPPITLNGRAVSSALSVNANPTQSGTVRTGQSRPVVVRG